MRRDEERALEAARQVYKKDGPCAVLTKVGFIPAVIWKGDTEGHEFHGNQHTGGGGGKDGDSKGGGAYKVPHADREATRAHMDAQDTKDIRAGAATGNFRLQGATLNSKGEAMYNSSALPHVAGASQAATTGRNTSLRNSTGDNGLRAHMAANHPQIHAALQEHANRVVESHHNAVRSK